MNEELRVAVLQLTSINQIEENLKSILKLIEQIPSSQKVDLVCLPENSLFQRLNNQEKLNPISLEDPILTQLHNVAQQRSFVLHLGAIPMEHKGRMLNTSVILWPDGKVTNEFRKIHLFDVDIDEDNKYRESDVFAHGNDLSVFELKGFRIGQTICFDLRFSEVFVSYARQGVDAILVPSSFTVPTGKAHWSVLLRSRAIETQSYVLAAAQSGQHSTQRSTYGHSMVVDPWGEVLVELTDQRIGLATLSKKRILDVRRQIPMNQLRRWT